MKLTDEQKSFLAQHGIAETEVFDAKGMTRESYKEKMKETGHRVAIGVTECGAAGHTMRNRHGTCIQCDPAAIAFQSRYKKVMHLYVAQPSKGSLVKIGITENIEDRVRQLNLHKLGGLTTWKIKFSVECKNAGTIENKVAKFLSEYNIPTPYDSKSGEVCEEVYDCSFERAKQAIEMVLKSTETRKKRAY